MDINDLHDLGTGLTVITIVIDKAKQAPQIDLDTCPPEYAILIFQKAIEMLDMQLPSPTITYKGEVIAEDVYAAWDDDDYDDD